MSCPTVLAISVRSPVLHLDLIDQKLHQNLPKKGNTKEVVCSTPEKERRKEGREGREK